ncbi:MAG: energy transducer TonB [Betaproteobacteria bacterium]|nr:energy transducer TonB [Betaproteobacteria bacterium]
MNAAAFPTPHAAARRRLALALTASALLHLCFATGMPAEMGPRAAWPRAMGPIEARLEMLAEPEQPARAAAPRESEELDFAPRAIRLEARRADSLAALDPERAVEPVRTADAVPARPPIRDPVYYEARELDLYPRPVAPLDFGDPLRAAREGVNGHLLMRVAIDEQGVVRELTVMVAEPAGYFEEQALAIFGAARFHPAIKDGRAVRSRIVVAVRFDAASGKAAKDSR